MRDKQIEIILPIKAFKETGASQYQWFVIEGIDKVKNTKVVRLGQALINNEDSEEGVVYMAPRLHQAFENVVGLEVSVKPLMHDYMQPLNKGIKDFSGDMLVLATQVKL
jgi:hypothetical protein